MLDRFEVTGFGCVKRAEFALTPIHAFIGPNDSGKSTLLRAVSTFATLWQEPNAVRQVSAAFTMSGTFAGVRVIFSPKTLVEMRIMDGSNSYGGAYEQVRNTQGWKTASNLIRGASMIRFDADALRRPSTLIPEGLTSKVLDARGFGLPGIYQQILGRGDETFSEITKELRRLFPTVKKLRVQALSTNDLALEVELNDGTRVRADAMSEGMLYYLGYAALPHLSPVSILLIEEPENGLHPARISEIVRVLRSLSEKGTQILIATHSPLVVNELQGNEVSVVTRPSVEMGTQVTPITATPNFRQRAGVYALGELWLSYADGVVEAPLLTGEKG